MFVSLVNNYKLYVTMLSFRYFSAYIDLEMKHQIRIIMLSS